MGMRQKKRGRFSVTLTKSGIFFSSSLRNENEDFFIFFYKNEDFFLFFLIRMKISLFNIKKLYNDS